MKKGKQGRTATAAAKKATIAGIRPASGRTVGSGLGRRAHRALSELLIPEKSERSTYRTAFELAIAEGATDKVASLLQKCHKSGDARATYALATWYIHGVVFPVNAKKAVRFLRSASRSGVREAMYDLGYSYEIGFGVPKEPKKALELYVRAAQKGDQQAAREVVRCVYYGVGITKNIELAFLIRQLTEAK